MCQCHLSTSRDHMHHSLGGSFSPRTICLQVHKVEIKMKWHATFNGVGMNRVIIRLAEIFTVIHPVPGISFTQKFPWRISLDQNIIPNFSTCLYPLHPSVNNLVPSRTRLRIRASSVLRSLLLLGHASKKHSPVSLDIIKQKLFVKNQTYTLLPRPTSVSFQWFYPAYIFAFLNKHYT